jgi:hypothetical protein
MLSFEANHLIAEIKGPTPTSRPCAFIGPLPDEVKVGWSEKQKEATGHAENLRRRRANHVMRSELEQENQSAENREEIASDTMREEGNLISFRMERLRRGEVAEVGLEFKMHGDAIIPSGLVNSRSASANCSGRMEMSLDGFCGLPGHYVCQRFGDCLLGVAEAL